MHSISSTKNSRHLIKKWRTKLSHPRLFLSSPATSNQAFNPRLLSSPCTETNKVSAYWFMNFLRRLYIASTIIASTIQLSLKYIINVATKQLQSITLIPEYRIIISSTDVVTQQL
jgi:hypothetical protein